MPVASLQDFQRVIEKSSLLSAEQWTELRTWPEEEPKTLLARMVKAGWITDWQAQQLLAGKSQLFMGRYELLELIGLGGMGAVFKARLPRVGRIVALKVMNKQHLKRPQSVARFLREIRSAAVVDHPNLVRAYDADVDRDTYFLVMEYVSGENLKSWIKSEAALPIGWSSECIRQAALGLAYAHQRGMVHRDIKPQNLMLTPDGQVKILDFGLARFAMETAPQPLAALPSALANTATDSLTQVGIVMGTPDYIAPEQANDAHTADIRADIYSLGCTLYDLLAGHAPFAEGTITTKVTAHMERTATPLSEVRKDVPAELSRIVERMMAKDPSKRYQTPADVAAALEHFATPGTKSRGRRIGRLAAAAGLLLAVIGLTGYFYGGTIYRIVTDQGELTVEVDDPQIKVILAQKGITIHDGVNNFTVTVGQQNLKAGHYKVEVNDPRGGDGKFRDEFTLTRNGKAMVKVKFSPRDVTPPGPAAKTAPAHERPQKAGQTDKELIRGTWKPVSASFQGQQMPDAIFALVGPMITFGGNRVTWKTIPGKELADTPFAKFNLDGVFDLDPTKSPKTINLTVLGKDPKTPLGTPAPRALLGIYRLDGDTLELCVAIDPERPDERPAKFESVPGKWIIHMMVRRVTAGPPPEKGQATGPATVTGGLMPDKGRLVTSFGTGFKPITRDGLTEDQGGWRIDARDKRVVRLYEVQPPLEECLVYFRAKMKSANLDGRAYLEMWSRFPHGGEFFSKDLWTFVMGTSDIWKTVQVPFILQKEERPDLFKLNLHIESSGTVWIKDIELWQAPLPPTMKRPSNFQVMPASVTPATIASFSTTDPILPNTKEGVMAAEKGWKIEAKEARLVHLHTVNYSSRPGCALTYRAQMKSSDLSGKAYLEMSYHVPGEPQDAERTAKGVMMPLTGTMDWASYETSLALPESQIDRIKLYVRMEGSGTVWIRDIELLRGPLAK